MKLFLVHRPTVLASVSPYRLLDEQGQGIAWANAFLDGQRIRQLSLRSLRAYAYDLLHFARGGANSRCHSLCRKSPGLLCSTMSASNSTRSPGLRPKP